ncbi:MAG: pyruvate kinase [Bacilli bacterium]|nr:pyruvate kinase [Bacilli bacterium]
MNKTKMISTVGPSSLDKEVIRGLIKSGSDVIRINMSHSNFDEAKKIIGYVREINFEEKILTGIMIDTKGPEIRIGALEERKVFLQKDKIIRLSESEIVGNKDLISLSSKGIISHIDIGGYIYLDSGKVKLEVIEKGPDIILCKILNDAIINQYSIVNIPNLDYDIKFLSNYDIECIKFACENKVDYLALSYVKDAADVLDVNDELIALNNNNIQIISKIENKNAIDDIENIIKASDGIMVSRGDLGLDAELEKIPSIQKRIVDLTKREEKVIIIATEMLASMKENVRPTRAEVSDVASSVSEQVDALMLSSETAIGKYPVQTVETMKKIIESTESEIDYNSHLKNVINKSNTISKAISYSAATSANNINADAIVCSTTSGLTAKLISSYRPACPVIAISPSEYVARGLSINYGIIPVYTKMMTSTDELVELSKKAYRVMLDRDEGKIVIVGSFPLSVNYTNYMKIEEIK